MAKSTTTRAEACNDCPMWTVKARAGRKNHSIDTRAPSQTAAEVYVMEKIWGDTGIGPERISILSCTLAGVH